MNRFLNFIRSLFTTAAAENNNTEVTDVDTNMEIKINHETSTEVVTDEPTYTDVFGTTLRPGTLVVGITYNDVARRGYYTIRKDFETVPVEVVNGAYIEYQRLLNMLDNKQAIDGRKHGYLHVMG